MPVRFRSGSAPSFSRKHAIDSSRHKCLIYLLLVGFVITLAACSSRPNVFGESREARLLRLEEERRELSRTEDPVERTRIQIRISDLMISFMGDAVAAGDTEQVEARLAEYRSAIIDARDTMMASGRNPVTDVAGYQNLEIALRQQIRQLDDIGTGLTVTSREPIEALIIEMTEIRNELLDSLFPTADPV